MKKSFFMAVILCTCFVLSGQDNKKPEQNQQFKHALGIGAGWTTGYGLSYRYMIGQYGAQATFAPYKDNYTTQFSAGLTFLINLIDAENANLFLYQGNHYFYSKDEYYYGSGVYIVGDNNNSAYVDQYLNIGFGIGIEFIILKRVSFNLMGGYAGYENFERISLTGETGLYYKF
jgi:hypothetical protein